MGKDMVFNAEVARTMLKALIAYWDGKLVSYEDAGRMASLCQGILDLADTMKPEERAQWQAAIDRRKQG